MATIVRTPAKTWKAVIRKSGWPTQAKTFRTRKMAEDWARHAEDEIARGVYIDRAPAEHLTVRAALMRYVSEVTPSKKLSTRAREPGRAAALIRGLGAYSLAALTPDVIAAYRDARLETLKPNTVRLELALLSHLYTTAIREWHLGLTVNPVGLIRKPSLGPGRLRRLEPDEESRLLPACDTHSNPMLGWIVRLALETAMRKSELLNLTCDQVDLEKRTVLLYDTKNGRARSVPLTLAAVCVMRAALEHSLRPADCSLIFFGNPGRDGVRRSYEFSKAWRDILERLHIDDFHFHDLRHEAISRLVEDGFSDTEVMEISGHRSAQMMRRYAHLRSRTLLSRLDSAARRRAETDRHLAAFGQSDRRNQTSLVSVFRVRCRATR